MEYLLACKLPLEKEEYDKLEEEYIEYCIDEEGLVFETAEERKTASKLLNIK